VTDGNAKRTVALFVDYEHLRRHTESAQHPVCLLSSALEAVALRVQELGDVVTANVYADWEKNPGRAGEVKRLHLDPRFVFSNSSGPAVQLARTNGSVVSMAMDALETMRDHAEIDTFVLVSDDAGLADLISRLRRHGRETLLVGFERGMPGDLLDSDVDFEPIESYVQHTDMQHEDTPPSPEAYDGADAGFDWEAFVLLLSRLESSLPFISLKYLKNSVLTPAHGCGSTTQSKGDLIRRAISAKVIDTRKIPNPRNPEFGTTVCQLNRRHPEVRRILGTS
jgi:hypothetical protein